MLIDPKMVTKCRHNAGLSWTYKMLISIESIKRRSQRRLSVLENTLLQGSEITPPFPSFLHFPFPSYLPKKTTIS